MDHLSRLYGLFYSLGLYLRGFEVAGKLVGIEIRVLLGKYYMHIKDRGRLEMVLEVPKQDIVGRRFFYVRGRGSNVWKGIL